MATDVSTDAGREAAWRASGTYALDFDGVVHQYPGWCDVVNPPLHGAFPAIYSMMEQHAVYILCARLDIPGPGGLRCIPAWFKKWGFERPVYCDLDYNGFWNRQDVLLVTNRKLPAKLYIDDRGHRFYDWDETMNWLRTAEAKGML